MKKMRLLVLALMMVLALGLAGCGGSKKAEPAAQPQNGTAQTAVQEAVEGLRAPVNGDTYKFGIVMKIENGAFLDMKEGIIDGLAAAGFVEGENVEYDYQNAQGDDTNLATICQGRIFE